MSKYSDARKVVQTLIDRVKLEQKSLLVLEGRLAEADEADKMLQGIAEQKALAEAAIVRLQEQHHIDKAKNDKEIAKARAAWEAEWLELEAKRGKLREEVALLEGAAKAKREAVAQETADLDAKVAGLRDELAKAEAGWERFKKERGL